MGDRLMIHHLIAKLDCNNDSERGGAARHIAVIASDNTTENNRIVLTLVRRVHLNNAIRVILKDGRPEVGIARRETCNHKDHG